MRAATIALLLGCLAGTAMAEAPEASLRPEGRPGAEASAEAPAPERESLVVAAPAAAPAPPAEALARPGPAMRPATRPELGAQMPGHSDLEAQTRTPDTSTGTPMPQPRPAGVPDARAPPAPPPVARVRPPARPDGAGASAPDALPDAPPPAPVAAVPPVEALPAMTVPRPRARPPRVERRAARLLAQEADAARGAEAPPAPTQVAAGSAAQPPRNPGGLLGGLFQRSAQPLPPVRGSVCGNRAIRGEKIAPIQGAKRGCGIAEPVRVTEVAGVRLSTPATIDCPTAQALHAWVENGAKPAVGRTGGGLAALQVAAHYACRTRNNRPGARISEHGRGRAIDISAIVLENGQRITVLHGWRSSRNSTKLREMHRAACGPFGTVLGPNSDRFHQDHFHFDTASYRSGPYCR